MTTPRKNFSEEAKNSQIVNDQLVTVASVLALDDSFAAHIETIRATLLEFCRNQQISLLNLLADEQDKLFQILIDAIAESKKMPTAKFQQYIVDQLTPWEQILHHAVIGRDKGLKNLHASQSTGMAADLISGFQVPHGKWGTDLDIVQCLGSDLTKKPRVNITAPGVYILSPVSLTESKEAIKQHLVDAYAAAQSIAGPVSLRIPVNCGNNHWRLAKVEIDQKSFASAELWDSLGGDPETLKKSYACVNFQVALNQVAEKPVKLTPVLANVQSNGFSCMDYSLQEAYRNQGVVNEITAAKEPGELRLGVVKKIAKSIPELSPVADALTIANVGGTTSIQSQPIAQNKMPVVDKIQVEKIQAELHQTLKHDKDDQIKFDEIFSRKLQEIYNKDKLSSEKELEKKAFEAAYKEFGLFKAHVEDKSSAVASQPKKQNKI